MTADPHEPRDMKGTMSEFLEGEGMHELGELLRIKEAWVRVVGSECAGLSKPYRLEAGRLFVGVGSHGQVQNMLFRGEEIRMAVRKETGIEIKEITVRKINLR